MNRDQVMSIAIDAVMYKHAMQSPGELADMLAVVSEIKPDRLAEIGCMLGGTLFCWDKLGVEHVYGITTPVNDPSYVKAYGADLLFGDSHTRKAFDWLVSNLDGALLDVLFIDGDHSAAGCRADWIDYAPLVRGGGLVIFHDIVCEPAVKALWRELKAAPRPEGRTFTEFWAGPDADPAPGVGIITLEGDDHA